MKVRQRIWCSSCSKTKAKCACPRGTRSIKTAWGFVGIDAHGKQVRTFKAEWSKDDAEREAIAFFQGCKAKRPRSGMTLAAAAERYLEAKSRKRSLDEDTRILEHLKATFGEATPLAEPRAMLAPLQELHHQLATLLDKVAGQQAYVLIFGPLKSGKSTLMNALAAAYVSEVSCLPAYPCLVFVGHGAQRRYHVVRYDGGSEVFADGEALAARIRAAHVQLAGHLRDRFARLTHDPDRAFLELRVVLASCLHRPSPLRRCLHDTRGSPCRPRCAHVGCPRRR